MNWVTNSCFCRFLAKVLVFLMIIQGWPLWELSQSYEWNPTKFVRHLEQVLELFGPGKAHAQDPADCIENLSVRPKTGKVQLTWTHEAGTARYDILRSFALDGPFDQIATTQSTYSTYLDESVNNGILYYYQIQRVPDDGSPSCLSDVIAAIPPEERIRQVTVPDVIYLAQADAESTITGASLSVGTIDFANDDTVPPGDVISQDPPPNSVVLPEFAVNLKVSLGQAMVVVPDVAGLPQGDAESAIISANLTVGSVTTAHNNAVPIGDVIGQTPAAGTVAVVGSAVDIVVSLGPAPVAVPVVVGLPQADAQAAIVAANLTVGTVNTANSSTVPAGHVISQSPADGALVAPGTAVDLVVSLGPVTVAVPNVAGQPQAAAEATILAATLTVGTITTANSDTVPAGNVISQNPVGGTSVAEGSSVDLVISLGPVMVLVPDVVGQTQAIAEAAILASNLTVGAVTTENSDTAPAGSVISQNPVGGTSVAEGSAVDIVVSLGPVTVSVPDVVGQTQANAEATIVAANLTVGNVTTANSDTVPAGSVISQNPVGGTSVPQGSAVDLVVSLGHVMVLVPAVVGQVQADAEAAIIAANLAVGTVTTANSDTVPAGSVISQSPVGGTSVAEGSTVDLIVSLGPVMVSVPDVVSQTQANAEASILAASLTVGTVTTANSDTVPAGDVISQNPVGGTSVVEGSPVNLVVSLGPVMVLVPDVVGQTQADAETAILAASLTVGTVTTANSDTVPAGSVISLNPVSGTSVAEGSSVDLAVSLGPVMVLVPDVVGQTQAAAEAAILAASLTVGTVTTANSDTVPAGSVISQNPVSGTSVAEGSAVDLVISLGPVMILVPDVVGQAQANAEAAIIAASLTVGTINTQNSSTVPAGSVISQVPVGGTSVAVGSAVNLAVSLGPVVIDDFIRPEVTVSAAPTAANTGDSIIITVNAVDNVGVVSKVLTVNGATVPLDGSGTATYSSATPGVFTAVATAQDAAGNEGLANAEFRFLVPGDTIPPTVVISAPANEAKLAQPADIIGTASDDTELVRYTLEYSVKDRNEFIVFAEGTSPVTNDVLGQIDPTILRNGLYDIKLTAEDAGGNTAWITRTYQMEGEMKVGNFTISFNDLTIPMAGIPITITRTYDSRVKSKGDFGIGWTIDLKAIEVQENRTPGDGWEVYCTRSIFSTCIEWGVRPTKSHSVLVAFPDGRDHEFDVQADTSYADPSGFAQGHLTFAAQAGTFSTLQALDSTTYDLLLSNELIDLSFNIIDPNRYRLSDVDGTIFECNQSTGLEQITDPNGNTITFTAGGIIHSAGKSVTFTRDGQGRIIAIIDPMGNLIEFDYDFYGDLVSVTDQEGNITRFTYNSAHGLVDIIDPRGITPARNEYDNDGRLVAIIDADGNRVEFAHNVGTRQEVITDRMGNVTVYEYDDAGNVVAETDALGNTTTSTYDANGNKLSETDPLGNTTTYTYDARDNMLTKTDPLGNATTYTYNSQNQLLTTTDPKGNVTSNTYDAKGNLLTTTDPLSNVTTNTYDASGNLRTMTDPLGQVTSYTYNSYGNKLSQTDPLGNTTTYTYDDNGNQLTKTTTRTIGSGPETLTTTSVYDGLNRVVETIDALGNSTTTEYNAIGKQSATSDKNGKITTFEYHPTGNLFKTSNADGTTETTTYDAGGNLTTFTDRPGRMTTYTYDALKRLIRTTYSDGSIISTAYDAAGKELATTNELGNTTSYTYDAAGRKTSTTDALGNVSTYTYDANGNQLTFTDANGITTTYEYDANNRKTGIIFNDGTTATTAYDALGRKISETDQAGITTEFEYDARGRLTKVTDALGEETSYSYDEVGNKIAQTDANDNTTSWEYDKLGRVTRRTLPLGMSETFTYDAVGNILTNTDFNGDTISFAYDTNNRLITKTLPDSSTVVFTYTAAVQRSTVTDYRGVTSYSYDSRDRLTMLEEPDGTTISYVYDAAGNRTSVTIPSGTTAYTFDALNRLQSVTDPAGGVTSYAYDNIGNRASVTYPSGCLTSYTYDALNRLTYQENARSDLTLISSYTYTLGPAGNRTQVVENTGRTVDYTYDALYRLVEEDITDAALGNETISYTYDPVGNRLSKTDSSGTINFTYDANDRLITEAGNTYAYDDNGNTLSKNDGVDTTTYTYDYENRLISADTPASLIDYEYDADGIRVSSTVDGVVTDFLVDKNRDYSQVLEERDDVGALMVSYVYGDDLISQNRNNQISYYIYDGQGSTRQLTDSTETTTDTYVFDAFGIELNRTGTTENTYLYTGEQYDPNVGFYYLRARYYHPEIGRFITMDRFLGRIYDPSSLHKYSYTGANPVNRIDPSGYFSLTTVMVTVAIIAVLVSIAVPNYMAVFGKFAGNTDRFTMQVLGGGALGQILFGGALAIYIWEEAPSDSSYYPHRARGLFTVFMLGFGGGAKGAGPAAGAVGPAGMSTFQTATKRTIRAFQGIGRMTAIELGLGVVGVGIGAMHLPDGTYLDVSFGWGPGITWGLAGYVVMTVWWLRILEQLW